jgi:hypothetical protein
MVYVILWYSQIENLSYITICSKNAVHNPKLQKMVHKFFLPRRSHVSRYALDGSLCLITLASAFGT